MDGPYDTFLDLYDSLRKVFSDDPGELIRSERISADADRVVRDTHALTHGFRIQETFGRRRKTVDYVPAITCRRLRAGDYVPARFRGVWSDYLKRWSTFVDYYVGRDQRGNDDFMLPPIEYPDELLPRGESRFSFALRAPDPTEDGEFDPLTHYGRGIWEMIENLLGSRIEDDPALADESSNRFGITCDYLYLLRTDLRMDLDSIERRWRMVPPFLPPQHVVEHDLATKLNLYDNLHSAVTAFIFGARKAALALCRATLETILLDFYAPDLSARLPRLDKPERPARRLGLDEIVKAARGEHELIRAIKDRIFYFKNLADTALHRRETNASEDMAREKETARFMERLAVLIQSAPERPEGLQSGWSLCS